MKIRTTVLATGVLAVLLITSCAIFNGPSIYEAKFKKQVIGWIPLGTSVIDAERTMKAKGFDVTRRAHEATEYTPAHEELACRRTGSVLVALSGARQRWHVNLDIKDEKIVCVNADCGGW